MTDHAAVVREALHVLAKRQSTSSVHNALAALAALGQELARLRDVEASAETAEAQYETVNREWGVCAGRMVAAEAEVAEAKQRIAYLTAEAHGWQPRLAKAEEALRDLIEYASRMPGYSLHPHTERARALAGEDAL